MECHQNSWSELSDGNKSLANDFMGGIKLILKQKFYVKSLNLEANKSFDFFPSSLFPPSVQPTPPHHANKLIKFWVPNLKLLGKCLSVLSGFADEQHVLLKIMNSWWCLYHPQARGDLIAREKQAEAAEGDFMGTKLQRTSDKKPIQLMHFPRLFRQMAHTI